MTNGEKRLWRELKQLRSAHGIHVRKQVPIGPYVADFAIHSAKLIIEADGHFHLADAGLARDQKRDASLSGAGFRVLHLTTADVADAIEGCVEKVLIALGLKP
jgi:very-short-patch-repair endonuclease